MSHAPLETVILIDDSKIDNRLHQRVIERSGLARNVLCFAMPDEALKYLHQPGAVPADLILLDINMPCMDGFELLDAAMSDLGEAFVKSVVVMLTTSMDPADQDRATRYGMIRDYFIKPLTRERFAELVDGLADDGTATAA